MGHGSSGESPALNHAGKTFALGLSSNVNQVARLEEINRNGVPCLQLLKLRRIFCPELPQIPDTLYAGFGQVPFFSAC